MQADRVAAQLREAARDMARIAARRAKGGMELTDRSCPESGARAPDAEDTSPDYGETEHPASRNPD
jgi:hypothetical protein